MVTQEFFDDEADEDNELFEYEDGDYSIGGLARVEVKVLSSRKHKHFY